MSSTNDASIAWEPEAGPWAALAAMLPASDWTAEAAAGLIPRVVKKSDDTLIL